MRCLRPHSVEKDTERRLESLGRFGGMDEGVLGPLLTGTTSRRDRMALRRRVRMVVHAWPGQRCSPGRRASTFGIHPAPTRC